MIHRLGMHYLARQLQDAQDAKAALQRGRRAPGRYTVADHEEFGLLARIGAALVAAVGALGFILWMVN